MGRNPNRRRKPSRPPAPPLDPSIPSMNCRHCGQDNPPVLDREDNVWFTPRSCTGCGAYDNERGVPDEFAENSCPQCGTFMSVGEPPPPATCARCGYVEEVSA